MAEITEKLKDVYVTTTVSAPLRRELNEGMLPLYDLEATVLSAKQDPETGLRVWLHLPRIRRSILYEYTNNSSMQDVLSAGHAATPEELVGKPLKAYISAGLAPVGITADPKRLAAHEAEQAETRAES